MAQLTLPTAPKVHTTIYGDLKGVDFSNDPAIVYRKRSPSAVNMISDKGGNPKKRTGWKTEFSELDFKEVYETEQDIAIKNLYSFELGGKRHLVIFTNVAVFVKRDGALSLLTDLSDVVEEPYRGFFFQSANGDAGFYFFGSEQLWAYKSLGEGLFSVSPVSAYVPHIRIWDAPKGSSTILDGVNLLTRKVKETYIGDSMATTYYTSFPMKQNSVSIRAKTNGVWNALTSGYTINYETQSVTFSSPQVPVPATEDNVEITYEINSKPENVKNFFKCKCLSVFGNGVIDSIFLSGCADSDFSSYVWYSKAGDPTYWPDTNYLLAGSNDTKVMGLCKIGEYLGMVKEGAATDATIYLAYPTTFDSETTYATKQSVSGIGAVSGRCFSTLGDEPLFLSKEGVCGVASTSTTDVERAIKNRSFFINKKLLEETDLEQAVAATWDGFYIVCINSHCYLLDSRQKTAWQTEWTNYLYECYYWENVPASCMIEHENCLWFGTADGSLCRFKTEAEEDAYNDNGEPIFAEWSTPIDNDGATQLFKTLQKKGSLVTIQPGLMASVDLYICADGQNEVFLGRQYADRFYWSKLNFARFPFTSNMAPKDFYINKKKKKYKRLQIILRNNGQNEGFSVYEIVKLYTVGNYSKKKQGEGIWRL